MKIITKLVLFVVLLLSLGLNAADAVENKELNHCPVEILRFKPSILVIDMDTLLEKNQAKYYRTYLLA